MTTSHVDLTALAHEALDLAQHVAAMADDAYLTGHPEWLALVGQANIVLAHAREAAEVLDQFRGRP